MQTVRILLVLVLLVPLRNAAADENTGREVITEEIPLEESAEAIAEQEYIPGKIPPDFNPLLVRNFGDHSWQIIRNSYPVLGHQFHFANAMPTVVSSERFLHGWSEKQVKAFAVSGSNLLGFEVFRLKFQLHYRYGGQANGEGRYIGAVALVPIDFDSWWSYSVDFSVCGVQAAAAPSGGEVVSRLAIQVCLNSSTVFRKVRMKQYLILDAQTGDVSVRPAVWY
jgi:hypothetical protein